MHNKLFLSDSEKVNLKGSVTSNRIRGLEAIIVYSSFSVALTQIS